MNRDAGARPRAAAAPDDASSASGDATGAPRRRTRRRTRKTEPEATEDKTATERSTPAERRGNTSARAGRSSADAGDTTDGEATREKRTSGRRRRRRTPSAETESAEPAETPDERPARSRSRSTTGRRTRRVADPKPTKETETEPPGPTTEREGNGRRRRGRRGGGRTRSADSEDQPLEQSTRPSREPARAEPPATRTRSRSRATTAPRTIEEFFSEERLYACQRAVRYHFRDITLLENALTHSSIKSDSHPSYERLEFLGDAVVGIVVSEYLYNLLPDCDEGELTKVKSEVVSTLGLANAARNVGLENYLAVGRGIQMKDGLPRGLVADVFEAVVGAIYLDRGYEAVRLYVLDQLRPFIEEALSDRSAKNFKSVLQQVAQHDFGETPRYEVLGTSGPDHARVFKVVAVVGSRRFEPAKAETKKDAEQAAAKMALQAILREKSKKSSRGRRSRSR